MLACMLFCLGGSFGSWDLGIEDDRVRLDERQKILGLLGLRSD